jgi:hypothetical protein
MAELKGWHSRGYLPHFDSPETIQFVTFRLADSLPRQALEPIRMQKHFLQHLDHELDAGLGLAGYDDLKSPRWSRMRCSTSMASGTTFWLGALCQTTSTS